MMNPFNFNCISALLSTANHLGIVAIGDHLPSNNTFFAPMWLQGLIYPEPTMFLSASEDHLPDLVTLANWLTDAAKKLASCGCQRTAEWRRSRTRCVCLTYWGLRCCEAWAAVLGPTQHSVTQRARRSPAEPRPVVCAEFETSVDN